MAPITKVAGKKSMQKKRRKPKRSTTSSAIANVPQLIAEESTSRRKAKVPVNYVNNRKVLFKSSSSNKPASTSTATITTTTSNQYVSGDGPITNNGSSSSSSNEIDLNNSSTTIADLLRLMERGRKAAVKPTEALSGENFLNDDGEDTATLSAEVLDNGNAVEKSDSNANDDKERNIKWLEECTFATKAMVDEFLQLENCWSYRGCTNTAQGEKILYRCNRVKRTSKVQCAAGIYIIEKISYVTTRDADIEGGDEEVLTTTTKSSFILYRKSAAHTHDQLENVVDSKVKEYVKKLIINQFNDGRKPKKIFYNLLENKDIPLSNTPTHLQVVNVINSFKRSNYGDVPITMRQLSTFIEKHTERPTDVDEPFVIRYEKSPSNVKENKFFRFFISTSRLLHIASKSSIVHADATHKVTTEKIPLIALGVTDANNKLHFCGLTLANHETGADYALSFRALRSGIRLVNGVQIRPTVLVSDKDSAIHNGFKSVFWDGTIGAEDSEDDDEEEDDGNGDRTPLPYTIIMCYFHITLNIQTKYKFQIKTNKGIFKDDVYVLHLCDTEEKFDIGCALFVKKWATVEPEATRLIHKSFFKRNKNWFIGCTPRAPKHNNGLESFNSSMKRCELEHQRQPLKQFLNTAFSIVRQRSLEYLKGKEGYQSEVRIDTLLMKRGCDLNLKFVHDAVKPDGGIDFYAFRSDMQESNSITLDIVNTYKKKQFKTFAEFAVNAFQIWKITFPKDIVVILVTH